jgi:hypothetical protein
MPDYPYIHGTGGPQPVEPGSTRVRFFRRRRGGGEGEGDQERDEATRDSGEHKDESKWRTALEQAVEDLNSSFRDAGVPMVCALEEDEHGLCLHIRRHGSDGTSEAVEEEVLDAADFPKWLARIRSRLGLLVDERA